MGIIDVLRFSTDFIIMYAVVIALWFYLKNQKQRKRSTSLDFIKRWNDGGYQVILTSILNDPQNYERDIREAIKESVTEIGKDTNHTELVRIWDFFEELSIAIIFNEADDAVAKEFFYYTLIQTYRVSEKAFYELRERQHNPALYANFERVLGKWSSSKEYTLVRETR
jgi:hypothetical protein